MKLIMQLETRPESGLVEAIGASRRDPFTFDEVVLTSRGKYQIGQLKKICDYERTGQPQIVESVNTWSPPKAINLTPVVPVSSPFGFTPEDWGMVTENIRDPFKIYVVFGHHGYPQKLRNIRTETNILHTVCQRLCSSFQIASATRLFSNTGSANP